MEPGRDYYLVAVGGSEGVGRNLHHVVNRDGEKVLPVFSTEEEGEAFCARALSDHRLTWTCCEALVSKRPKSWRKADTPCCDATWRRPGPSRRW